MQETATAAPGQLANPATGEPVELDAPDERLAARSRSAGSSSWG